MVPLSGGAAGRAEGERSPEHTKIVNHHGTDRPRPVTAINKSCPASVRGGTYTPFARRRHAPTAGEESPPNVISASRRSVSWRAVCAAGKVTRCGIACGQRRAGQLRTAARRAREAAGLCRPGATGLRAHRDQCVAVGATRRASRCDHPGAGRHPGPSHNTTVGRPGVSGRGAVCRARTQCAGQATFGTSAAWSAASSRPRPAAMALTARRTLAAALVSTVGSACDQPAT